MKHVREILNEIKWRNEFKLEDVNLYYADRKLDSLMQLPGSMIKSWDKSFIYTVQGSAIPFHRIKKVEVKGVVVYDRV